MKVSSSSGCLVEIAFSVRVYPRRKTEKKRVEAFLSMAVKQGKIFILIPINLNITEYDNFFFCMNDNIFPHTRVKFSLLPYSSELTGYKRSVSGYVCFSSA